MFDVNGLMISSGSACSSGAAKASVLMKHLGYKDEVKNGLRLSLPLSLTEVEFEMIEEKIKIILEKMK
jgi:cysteine sulfinate desulfinase/cysteine desulfurase-like protein